jgi:hypothetical protein
MRKFYLAYEDRHSQLIQTAFTKLNPAPISQTSSGKFPTGNTTPPFTLSWSHYVFLIGIKNLNERQFYEIESTQNSWSISELTRQFNSGLYERFALSRKNADVCELF